MYMHVYLVESHVVNAFVGSVDNQFVVAPSYETHHAFNWVAGEEFWGVVKRLCTCMCVSVLIMWMIKQRLKLIQQKNDLRSGNIKAYLLVYYTIKSHIKEKLMV